MNRKLALVLAAIVLPGGLIALFGAIVMKALTQTQRGRKVIEVAEKRMRAIGFAAPLFGERQAA